MFTCRGCNIDFTPKRKGQEYHDINCYLKSTTKLISCPECGVKFKRKSTKQVCCSPICAFSYRAERQTKGVYVKCSFDGKSIYKMKSKIRKHNFCDNVCKIAYLRSDKNEGKKRKHTLEEIEKIRQASLSRDYNKVFTEKTRQKLRKNARKTILRPDVMEKTRLINKQRMLGSVLSEITKQRIRANAKYGSENIMWKELPSNVAIHLWANRHLPLPKICVKYDPTGNDPCSKRIEASSKGNKHLRDISNWEWMCTTHHDEHEFRYGLVNPTAKTERFYRKYGNTHMREITMDAIVVDRKESIIATNYS